MRKHRLHLNALVVESFAIPRDAGQGTVRGHEIQPDDGVGGTPSCTCPCTNDPTCHPTRCGESGCPCAASNPCYDPPGVPVAN